MRCSVLLSFEDDKVMYMQSADYTYILCALLYVTAVGMKYLNFDTGVCEALLLLRCECEVIAIE